MDKCTEEQQIHLVATQLAFKELKDAAEKLGYDLVKKKMHIQLKPCPICGKKRTEIWYSASEPQGDFRKCKNCGFKSGVVTKKSELNQAWNNAVDEFDEYLKGR